MNLIEFKNNIVNIQLNTAVSYVSLFNDQRTLENSKPDSSTLTGTSQKFRVHYTNNNPQPRLLTVKIGIVFPEDKDIKLSGGGPNDTYVEASDGDGHRGVWSR
ncbi:unnamed protein product [Fusarium venenatum]|uniref:Uncharacterized protein n=1 Tax=Fusarium venenatum TaxID=56646 RepID=A0A2L2TZ35_9HYPO|nr:uncharacterized protein FVRRES_10433 [Fusarium venenatum]CEI70356.1 unnamed protein product [Fusarium venenatum]